MSRACAELRRCALAGELPERSHCAECAEAAESLLAARAAFAEPEALDSERVLRVRRALLAVATTRDPEPLPRDRVLRVRRAILGHAREEPRRARRRVVGWSIALSCVFGGAAFAAPGALERMKALVGPLLGAVEAPPVVSAPLPPKVEPAPEPRPDPVAEAPPPPAPVAPPAVVSPTLTPRPPRPDPTEASERAFRDGWAAFARGDHAAAEALFASAERLAPRAPLVEDAIFARALALTRLGRSEEAIATYDRYLVRYPSGVRRHEAAVGLGELLLAAGQLDAAREKFEDAVRSPIEPVRQRAERGLRASTP